MLMATYSDLVTIRRCLKVWSQALLLSIFCHLPAYAAGEEVSAITTVLGVESAEEVGADDPESNEIEVESSDPTKSNVSTESEPSSDSETTATLQQDNNIRQRINGIFSEIDGLQTVTASVTQGVVTLTGETPNEKKAQQAISLANRLTGVVTVEDQIIRTLDVQDNVTTVYQGLKAQTQNLIKASPLLLVGIVIFGLVYMVW